MTRLFVVFLYSVGLFFAASLCGQDQNLHGWPEKESLIEQQPGLDHNRDVTVCFIKRLPEIDYVWGSTDPARQGWPAEGEIVTWRAHIKSWFDHDLYDVPFQWYINGQPAGCGFVDVPAGSSATAELEWIWTFERHRIRFVIDPSGTLDEWTRQNNALAVFSDAIALGLYVEQGVYDYFHEYQPLLGIASNSWEEWAQRQVTRWNRMFQQSVYVPDAPQGVLDRIRIDEIHVVGDGALPLAGGLPTNNPNNNDRTVDLQWGFPATLIENPGHMYSHHTGVNDSNPFYIEPSLIHELGHARYLIDSYGFDTHNTAHHGGYDAVQIWEGGIYVGGSAYMPYLAWEEVLYYNRSGGVMSGPYGFRFSPYETMALNLIAGHRAWKGNCNAPNNIGVYLQDLPENNHVRIMDGSGAPRINACVRIYNATSGPGWYGKTFDDLYDQEYFTDLEGYIHLPRNPFNPGKKIVHTYGKANGVMILRIEHEAMIRYCFMEVSDFNMEYWRGHTDHGYYRLCIE
ncbi:MAG: hypothetical protein ABIK28_08840 [Planctomycetota bacterium]